MGILNDVDVDITKKRLRGGDMVIMVTDGITDIWDSEPDRESFLVRILKEHRSINPQDTADYILKKCQEHIDGEVKDDMTIMVARMWEKK